VKFSKIGSLKEHAAVFAGHVRQAKRQGFFPRILRSFLLPAVGCAVALSASAGTADSAGWCDGKIPGSLGEPPRITVLHDVTLDRAAGCPDALHGPAKLFITLTGQFEVAGGVDEITRRLGAISATRGLLYWSVTDEAWRPLIEDAAALQGGPDGSPRADFSAADMRSGRILYFGQNDTRSTGTNTYAMMVRQATEARLVVEVVNVSAVKLAFVTLFEPRSLVSVHVFEHSRDDVWNYRGLTVVRDGLMVDGHEKSFVNRAAAYYRFLIGVPTDRDPPLAR
jgi:hypothetical protein